MKKLKNTLLMTMLAVLLCSCAGTAANTAPAIEYDSQNSTYLQEVLGVKQFAGTVSSADFTAAANKITGKEITADADILKVLVQEADFDELAQTYSRDKVSARLKNYGIADTGTYDQKYVVCALDAHLVDTLHFQAIVKEGSLDPDMADYLLMQLAKTTGQARHYLGRVSDPDIISKISTAFDNLYLFSYSDLDNAGAKLVEDKVTTGYNLKEDGYNANFLPELTIKYGHSEEVHLKQLVALLNSEGIDARLQLEPKISIYQYLLEWGPIPEPTPTYRVEKYSDNLYLVYATEYDAMFEFDNESDLEAFDGIINKYSKKNSANQAKGSDVKLISGAWWQPLYSTMDKNHDQSAYKAVYDCSASENGYTFHSFCLPAVKDNLLAAMKKEMSDKAKISVAPLYVDNAFYRYLNGESE
ncbi:MAG: hypothetical protein LKE40_09675 [Spirochaetia bacterium]|nr:hypothetical protein [Spirochaetia bacterium]